MTTSINHQSGQKLTSHAKNAFLEAEQLARKFKHAQLDNLHLLYAIYLEKGSIGSNVLNDLAIQKKVLESFLKKEISTVPDTLLVHQPAITENLKKTFTQAYNVAKKFNYPYVGTEHLIYAIVNSGDKNIATALSAIDVSGIRKSITSLFEPNHASNIPKIFDVSEINLGKKSAKKSKTPFIDKFCINVNSVIKKNNETIIGREEEIERIINVLGRKNKNNPILLGEAGVGKTAVVHGLAQKINSGSTSYNLCRKKIMSLDIAQLLAGTSFRGEFESRLKEIIKEIDASPHIILFIDELHSIVGAGNAPGGLDLANILKPALGRGDIQIIGATTLSEYKKHIEKDPALERRFQPIHINEPDRDETEKILLGIRKSYENFHNVRISDEVISVVINLSMRYIQNRFLPDKAIDVLDETASYVNAHHNSPKQINFIRQINLLENRLSSLIKAKENLVSQEDYKKALELREEEKKLTRKLNLLRKNQLASIQLDPVALTVNDVVNTVSRISKIPIEKISPEKSHCLKNISKKLSSQIIGQKEVIEKLSSTLLRSQAGVSSPDKPLGSFLFLGPTGVGKTLTAKILAQEFFAPLTREQNHLIRIDMSELMERHSISSLIGSPAGYIGYGEGGKLTEKVRRNPYSVILFDEIEKAHPDVFNILLQILEDGTLTDAEGTHIDFKNTIIILTSNIGTSDFTNAARIGFDCEETQGLRKKFQAIKENALVDLKKKMRPELLNRLDYILVFNALEEKDIERITKKELQKLTHRLAQQKISLIFHQDVIQFIARKSLASNQGARLIRKNIQEILESRIAEMIVYNKVVKRKINICIKNSEVNLV